MRNERLCMYAKALRVCPSKANPFYDNYIMNNKRLFFICSLLCLLMSWVGNSVSLAADSWNYPTSKPSNPFGGGDGSQWNPYRIETAQHLANLAYMVNEKSENYKDNYFILTNDITLNEQALNPLGTQLNYTEDSYRLWTPIGVYGTKKKYAFQGVFDGEGHTIRGMVCINTDGERILNGLFGATYQATIMDLNLVDCYVGTKTTKDNHQDYGILSGTSTYSTYINCNVSKALVDVNADSNYFWSFCSVYVGGMIGGCDISTDIVTVTSMTNCSYGGNIYVTIDNRTRELSVGGLLGYQNDDTKDDNILLLTNCSTRGDIVVKSKNYYSQLLIGGLSGKSTRGYSEIKGCSNYMNLTLEPQYDLETCHISGLTNTNTYSTLKVTQCASFGTIKVGDTSNKVNIATLHASGLCNEGYISGCAFYGKFDIHGTGHIGRISSLANKYKVENSATPSVVCSEGNYTDVEYVYQELDQVSYYTVKIDDNGNEQPIKHNTYYRFAYTGDEFKCNGTENETRYKKIAASELMHESVFYLLNYEAGSNIWGKITGMDENLNGLPMPIGCGGDVTGLAGQGSVTEPFLITCEAELRALQKGTADGSRSTEGIYFKLANDIYMSGNLMPAIGSRDYPFKGTFDGGGHAIVSMVAEKGCLFDYLAGTLRNLALVDFKAAEGIDEVAPLASTIGGKYEEAGTGSSVEHAGTIENCYVSGDLKITPEESRKYYNGIICGICGTVYDKGKVNNCYFKGSLEVAKTIDLTKTTYVFGGTGWVYGEVSNCYASYTLNNNDMAVRYDGFGSTSSNSTGPHTITNCYYVRTDQTNASSGDRLASESELNAKFSEVSGWSQGLYRPVLTSVKSYAATLPEGGTKYFDVVPEATPTSNYIVNVNVGSDPYADKLVWQLPNMAVYVPSEQTDYIINGYLDQSADFQYKPTTITVGENTTTVPAKGQLRYDLTQTDKGYHMICLPGNVERNDLPEGAKVMIVGRIQTVEGKEQVNVVMVDTIPAGVPCMLYVPTTSVAKDEKISLVMRSGIVSTPTVNTTYSDFKGTFATATATNACVSAKYSGTGETLPVFVRTAGDSQVKPFTAWLAGATGEEVQIVDYVLLDEENEAMTLTLVGLNSTAEAKKETNVKLRRTIKAAKWNTVCLPFDMTAAEIETAFGKDTKVEAFNGLEYDSNTSTTTLKFATAKAADGSTAVIQAGVPYLLKPGKTTDTNLFELKAKEIQCASETFVPTGTSKDATTTSGTVSLTMQGNYNKRVLTPETAADKKLYILSGDKIYLVDSDVEMKGFRCYFSAPEVSATSLFSKAMVLHGDGSTTAIRLVETGKANGNGKGVYDLLGRPRDAKDKDILIKGGKKVVNK